MSDPAAEPGSWIDPRVKRTRQMLHRALEGLLCSKPFGRISVGDIAEEATLNRATFYAHYPDKFALLEGLVAQRFQELLERREVVFDGTCSGVLRRFALAMCDYLAELPGTACSERREMDSHFESALMRVVRDKLVCGIRSHPKQGKIAPELLAAAISGAIYGGANEWVRSPNRGTPAAVVDSIYALVAPMLELG